MAEQGRSRPFARPLSSLNALTNRLPIVQDATPSDLTGRLVLPITCIFLDAPGEKTTYGNHRLGKKFCACAIKSGGIVAYPKWTRT
jgi:hypothetical protein